MGWDAFFPPQAIPFSVSVVFLTCRSRHPVHTHICCNQNRIEVVITRHTALQLALDSDESDARGPFFAGRRAAHVLAAARGWMRDRPEWAWPVFVGRGGGRCFCGLCNCYINCTLLHFSLAGMKVIFNIGLGV